MDSLLDKYKELWSPLILPDDYKYSMAELGEDSLVMADGTTIVREEFAVSNLKG